MLRGIARIPVIRISWRVAFELSKYRVANINGRSKVILQTHETKGYCAVVLFAVRSIFQKEFVFKQTLTIYIISLSLLIDARRRRP